MATTSAPLVWSFYRQVGADSSAHVVGNVHYYDEWSQTIFLNGGVKTRTAEVPDGHWRDSTLSDPSSFIDHASYHAMGIDHPVNGVLYGAASDGETLTFLRYIYGMDLSHLMDSWSWVTQSDSPIAQFSGAVQNIGVDIFTDDTTLFQPGARVSLSVRVGSSQSYSIGVTWLDECDYDISNETVDISARNTIGYYLRDQTFDNWTHYSGESSTIIQNILIHAGVSKFKIQPGTGTHPFVFDPSDTMLDGILEMCAYYTYTDKEWKILELPDGTVCIGYDYWFDDLLPNGYYSFDEGKDIFKRRTSKLADGSYTAIRVTGKDTDGAALTPVTVTVTNFPYWSLGTHRTKHIAAPDGMTQEELQAWAETQAQKLQYIGIGEDFTGPFRPQLLVGDVAEVVDGDVATGLGIITEVRQTFSRRNGYKTEFSVDSGGVVTDGASYTVYSRTAELNGFNRKQRVIDLVRYVSKK